MTGSPFSLGYAAAAAVAVLTLCSRRGVGHELRTAQGTLRGVLSEDGSHTSYFDIPYAGSTSKHRFKRAPPPAAWQGVRDALPGREAPCSSLVLTDAREDCLFLAVHAPTVKGEDTAPVVVWVQGGGFVSSNVRDGGYDPVQFTRRGVMMVAVNYRLGPLGFLCLGTEDAPGNAGVKDVLLALRWVRDNIVAFGGDAARVTLAGDGAGAAIAEALSLSTAAEGLFRAVILQSGTVLNPWAYNYDARSRAISLAKKFLNSSDLKELGRALTAASSEQLMYKTRELDFNFFPFALCTEKQFEKEERVIEAHPIDILNRKQFQSLPIIMGYNTNEAYVLTPTLAKDRNFRDGVRSTILPDSFLFASRRELKEIKERIQGAYFSSDNASRSRLLDLYSDLYFASGVVQSARLHAAAGQPVFLYEFGHAGRRGRGVPALDLLGKVGPAHSDELAYLFSTDINDEADGRAQRILCDLWTHFIKQGTVPAAWQPVPSSAAAPAAARVFLIDGARAGGGGMSDARRAPQLAIWTDTYDKYYQRAANVFS